MPVWGLVAAVALLGILVAGFAITAGGPSTTAAPKQTLRPVGSPSSSAEPSTQTTALFLGDSYSAGTGASRAANRWTSLVARSLDLQEENYARGGTGYLTTTTLAEACGLDYCANYLEMLGEASDEGVKPDVVFVAGGQNDFAAFEADPAAVTDAVNEVYESVRSTFPDARIVAVGPSTPTEITPLVTTFVEVVSEAAEGVDATFVSLTEPDVLTEDMLAEDGVHVLDAGHEAIAARVEGAI